MAVAVVVALAVVCVLCVVCCVLCCDPSKRFMVTPVVRPRLFELLAALTFGALRRNHTVSAAFETVSNSSLMSLSVILLSCLSLSLLFDNDNDHLFNHLSVGTAVSYPDCQSAGAVAPSLLGEHVRIMQKKTGLVPLGVKCACTCAGDGEGRCSNVWWRKGWE